MFLKPTILNALMKQAYKTGLVLANPKEKDVIYIAGRYWEAEINPAFIPKRTLGDIIALAGEIPDRGTRFNATKEGNQMEMELPMRIKKERFREGNSLTVTDLIAVGSGGIAQRLLQDEQTGSIYVVNNVFISIIDNDLIDADHGEYAVTKPLFTPMDGILWMNNVCALRAHFRMDDKNSKVLENLKGVDITPEIPE